MNHDRGYVDLDDETAPDAARAILTSTRSKLGFVPSAMARLAHAPALARAFQQAVSAFDRTSYTPLERELAIVTLARVVGCDVCVAFHRRALFQLAGEGLAARALEGAPLGDERLDALTAFTQAAFEHRGDVPAPVWARFLGAGFTREQALEMMLGIGAYVMSTFANRLTGAPVDPALSG